MSSVNEREDGDELRTGPGRPGTRSMLVWAARYGLPGAAMRFAARRGDLIARSAVDAAARADPVSLYDELREKGPVFGSTVLSASAHHSIVNQVLRHEASLVDPGGVPTKLLARILAAAIDPRALGPVDSPSLLAVQPPQHTRIRRLVGPSFTTKAIGAYADRIQAIADDLLDRAGSRFDLIDDYAAQLPVTVIAKIMGIPDHIRGDLLRIGNDAAMTLDPALSWRQYHRADRAIRDGNAMLDGRIRTLRQNPGDGLLSELVKINQDGDRLSDEELRVNTLLLLGAGFETTINLIGNAVALLLEHPDQLAALRANPNGWENAVEEVLRFDSPVQVSVRVPREDITVDGIVLPAGRPVLLMLAAANRDPAVFAEPNRFDITRPEARQHLAFSAGIHYCVGAQLARLEARIALQTLFDRHPGLTVAGTPIRRGTRVLRGYQHLPVAAAAGVQPA